MFARPTMRARWTFPTTAGIAVLWLGCRLASLPQALSARSGVWSRAEIALTKPREWRVLASTGNSPQGVAALSVLGSDGRLIAYGDLGRVPEAQRGYAELLLDMQHHRLRSLLYPNPSDTRRANSPDELRAMVAEPCAGEVVVADLSQTGEPLPVEQFTLLHEERHGGILVRYWRRSTLR
jgi:hypothetical protein